MARAKALAGLTLGEVARERGWPIPESSRSGKGWPGQLIEDALGASAASLPEPDFQLIGVELKTIPVDATADLGSRPTYAACPSTTRQPRPGRSPT